MTSVDIKEPENLDLLRKKFKAIYGETISDEEILEKCLKFSADHLEQLLSENENNWRYLKGLLNKQKAKKKPLIDFISDILEDEYEEIKKSGKTIKEVIRESWKY